MILAREATFLLVVPLSKMKLGENPDLETGLTYSPLVTDTSAQCQFVTIFGELIAKTTSLAICNATVKTGLGSFARV